MVVPKVFCLVWIFALEAEHSHVSMRDDFRQDSTQPRGLPEAYPPNALVNCGYDTLDPQPVSNKYKPRLGSLGRQLSDATYVT